MKEKTLAVVIYVSIALIVLGIVGPFIVEYLTDTESSVNKERVRMQQY